MSFRTNYSNLIMAIWDNPGLEKAIAASPAKITQFGFDHRPRSISFKKARSGGNVKTFDELEAAYTADPTGSVVFFIPPRPDLGGEGAAADTSVCCCCCPCCTCT